MVSDAESAQLRPHPLSPEALDSLGLVVVDTNTTPDRVQAVYVADPNHQRNLTDIIDQLMASAWKPGSSALVEGRVEHPGNAFTLPEGEPVSWENEFIYQLALGVHQRLIELDEERKASLEAWNAALKTHDPAISGAAKERYDAANAAVGIFQYRWDDAVVTDVRTRVMVDASAARLEANPDGIPFAITGYQHLTRKAFSGAPVVNPTLRDYLATQYPDQRYLVLRFKDPAPPTAEELAKHDTDLRQHPDALGAAALEAVIRGHQWPATVDRYLRDVPGVTIQD